MKIAVANFNYFPNARGHEIFAHNLANYLAKKHEVDFISSGRENIQRQYNLITLPFLNISGFRRPSFSRHLKRFLSKHNYDVVVANEFFSLLGCPKSQKTVYVHHGFFYEHDPRAGVRFLMKRIEEKIIAKKPSKVIGVKEEGEISNFVHLPVGVDTSLFRPMPNKRNHYVFLSPKNFYDICGVEYIVKAFNLAGLDDSMLLVIGEGRNEWKIKKAASNNPNIQFFKPIDYFKMPEIYNLADCVVFHALGGIQRTSLLEAVACGKPVIGTDIEPFSSMLDKKFIVRRKNIEELAEKIRKCAREKPKNNIDVSDYSWDKLGVQYEKEICKVAEE
jgi:glycosyltransferase involved in cell wall biosynthesis